MSNVKRNMNYEDSDDDGDTGSEKAVSPSIHGFSTQIYELISELQSEVKAIRGDVIGCKLYTTSELQELEGNMKNLQEDEAIFKSLITAQVKLKHKINDEKDKKEKEKQGKETGESSSSVSSKSACVVSKPAKRRKIVSQPVHWCSPTKHKQSLRDWINPLTRVSNLYQRKIGSMIKTRLQRKALNKLYEEDINVGDHLRDLREARSTLKEAVDRIKENLNEIATTSSK